jgi:tetratricopeptide (TPR) repeat protein
MTDETQNITLALLLQSLGDDFNPQERARILEILKNTTPKEESLLGAKMLLADNNWDYTALKNAFETTTNHIEQIASTSPKPRYTYLKYAAVLLPLTFIFGYFITITYMTKENIDQYYPKEEGLPNFMSPEKTNWDSLMILYRARNMKEAFLVSEEILAKKPQNDTAIYFHGIIGYELKNYTVAQKEYLKIAAMKESVFYYDGLFRLGFALKNRSQIKAAKCQFEKIATDSSNPYNQNAKVVMSLFRD